MKEATDSGALKQALQGPAQHEVWETSYRTARSEAFYEQAFDWLAKEAGIPPDGEVLDIGCGIGAHALRLALRGFRVTAADFSADRVAAARDFVRARGMESQVQVREEDLLSGLSFAPASFDGVLCWGVLMHIHENEKAMTELVRVVRAEGALIVAEANVYSLDGAASLIAGCAKRLLGNRQRKRFSWTKYGMEYLTSTPSGDLLVRHSRIAALVRFFEERGCRLQRRVSGQFTESYVKLGDSSFAAPVHAFNSAWFAAVKWATPAYSNILIFRRE